MTEPTFQPAQRGDWQRNAVVGGLWSNDWAYARGYLEAADILIEKALERGPVDLLFYPICFLYRHAAEMILKELIRDTERLLRVLDELGEAEEPALDKSELEKQLTRSHGLVPLLDRLIERLALVSDDDVPPEIRDVISEVDQLDPTGQGFRYSRTKERKGQTRPSFKTKELYDIRNLGQRLQTALSFLADGVGSWLEAQVDIAHDYLIEMKSMMPDGP